MCPMTNTTAPAPTVGGLEGGRGQLTTPGDNPALATSLTHVADRAVTVCVRIQPAPDGGEAQWSGRPDPDPTRVLCPQCGGRIVPIDTARGGGRIASARCAGPRMFGPGERRATDDD